MPDGRQLTFLTISCILFIIISSLLSKNQKKTRETNNMVELYSVSSFFMYNSVINLVKNCYKIILYYIICANCYTMSLQEVFPVKMEEIFF